VHVYHRLS